ncbi:MAG: vWA domain-containing protein [Evtepia sp.]|uniref:vWA domain-containing protein n=1 Tax=Evtepia sp. TaxID=2773933 RepID=UPI002A749B2C|nr:vWA domain-containing protein [Evtepia sp.]MDY3013894.1 vWA domain-containing protein [Evtepia sp.]
MKQKVLSCIMALVLVLGLFPGTALAEEPDGDTPTINVPRNGAVLNGTEYTTLDDAMEAASDGDTIYLGEGTYSGNDKNPTVVGKGAGKTLTFVGASPDKTTWNIQGPEEPYVVDKNCDYSFKESKSITFKNMTVVGSVYKDGSKQAKYLQGLAYIQNITLENCVFNGLAAYWGYSTTTFNNVTFNAPGTAESGIDAMEYSLWTWTGSEYTFNNCTFNSAGKVLNVYNEGQHGSTTINFKNCTVNSSNSDSLSVMNINDSLAQGFTVNFTGTNTVTGIKADGIAATDGSHASVAKNGAKKTTAEATCSKLFEFNMKYGNGNTGKTTVTIDGKTVWQDGKMVNHNIAANDGSKLYTDGYIDNAFTTNTTTQGKRTITTKTCKYCGWSEESSTYNWDVSRSKTATELNKNNESTVTLSLPSAEEKLSSDIVFVLDKSTSTDLKGDALTMLSKIKEQVNETGATVKVGVVVFNKTATVSAQLTDISTDEGYNAVKAGIETTIASGSNTHAGMLAGKQLLDNDTSVDAARKYLILVSDGVTYQFCKENDFSKAYTRNFNKELGGTLPPAH